MSRKRKLCSDRLQFHTKSPLSRHKRSCRDTGLNLSCSQPCRDIISPSRNKATKPLSRPQPLSPNLNPVATQHSLLRHGVNTSLSRQRSLCHDPTLLACLGTLSRHDIPCHDTAALAVEDPSRDTMDHVATWNPTTPIATENELSRAQNQVIGVLALLCALLRVQLACRARMLAALAMCGLSRSGTPVATKNLEMGSSPSHFLHALPKFTQMQYFRYCVLLYSFFKLYIL